MVDDKNNTPRTPQFDKHKDKHSPKYPAENQPDLWERFLDVNIAMNKCLYNLGTALLGKKTMEKIDEVDQKFTKKIGEVGQIVAKGEPVGKTLKNVSKAVLGNKATQKIDDAVEIIAQGENVGDTLQNLGHNLIEGEQAWDKCLRHAKDNWSADDPDKFFSDLSKDGIGILNDICNSLNKLDKFMLGGAGKKTLQYIDAELKTLDKNITKFITMCEKEGVEKAFTNVLINMLDAVKSATKSVSELLAPKTNLKK